VDGAALARRPPDFQGVWANNSVTPLQRPKQWENKTRLTDVEVADLQKFAAQIVENDGDAQFGDGLNPRGPQPDSNPKSYDRDRQLTTSFWLVDIATGTTAARHSSQSDRKLPPSRRRRRKRRARRSSTAGRTPSRSGNVSRRRALREFRAARACRLGYNSYLQIVQAPGNVAILKRDGARRAHRATRRPAASRQPDPDLERDPRGHWKATRW